MFSPFSCFFLSPIIHLRIQGSCIPIVLLVQVYSIFFFGPDSFESPVDTTRKRYTKRVRKSMSKRHLNSFHSFSPFPSPRMATARHFFPFPLFPLSNFLRFSPVMTKLGFISPFFLSSRCLVFLFHRSLRIFLKIIYIYIYITFLEFF